MIVYSHFVCTEGDHVKFKGKSELSKKDDRSLNLEKLKFYFV